MRAEGASTPELTTADRDGLDRGDFAYVDRGRGERLPIHDKEHVRNAVSRWNQTHFENPAAFWKAVRASSQMRWK